MEKKLIIILFFCIHSSEILYAQWTKEDSVWLDKVLSGKEQIKLNPETLQAIEEGTFINTEILSTKEQMKTAPSSIPISKDFSEYLIPLKAEKEINPLDVPPAVYMRYGLNIPLLQDKYNKAAFSISQQIKDNAQRPTGRSFDDMFRSIFQPGYRARVRNQKNANAWRTY